MDGSQRDAHDSSGVAQLGGVQKDLELARRALSDATAAFRRAGVIARAAKDSSSPAARAAAADEVVELRHAVLSVANEKGSIGYLFAGGELDAPFAPSGAYLGRHVPRSERPSLSPCGARAFTAAGGRDVIADLETLAHALTAHDDVRLRDSLAPLDSDVGQLERAADEVEDSLSWLGSRRDASISRLV